MTEQFIFTLSRDELHEPMGGGLPKGSLIVFDGPNATGKSVISERLTFGLLENGHTVTYISTEMTIKGLLGQMSSLDYSISNYLLNDKMLFLPVFSLIGKQQKKMDYVGRLMKRGMHVFEKDLVFIDCFSALIKDDPNPVEKVSEFLVFLKKITALGKSIILTLDPETTDPKIMSQLLSAADTHFNLSVSTVGGIVNRTIRLKRMAKATKPFEESVGYRIEPGVGLIVEITAYG